jgi:outer membrane protein assembly factor BamB
MRRRFGMLFLLLLVATFSTLKLRSDSPAALRDADKHWPQWRGPQMNGVAPLSDPPVEWSETKNVKWKVEIPGKGSATPIIWGDKIFVLTAVPTGKSDAPAEPAPVEQPGKRGPRGIAPTEVLKFTVLALRRSDGKVLWEKVVREEKPHEGTHPTGTWASNSAVTDGKNVYAFFGSRGLYALDFNGKLLWEKDFGDMTIKLGFGEGSSPALYGDRLVVNWDHEGESFITAVSKTTGKEFWRTKRDETTSWTTPLVIEHNGRAQVVTSASGKIRSYDVADGKLLWESTGMTANAIPTPVYADGVVYLTSGFRGNALMAVRLAAAKGDLSGSTDAVVWKYDRDTPYVPSPLLYGNQLYILKSNNGILTAFNARSGERLYGPERLEAVPNVYASPLGAAGRVYIAGREGGAVVLAAGPEFKVLAANQLDDGFDASPVAVDKELYLRGKKFLYRISKD